MDNRMKKIIKLLDTGQRNETTATIIVTDKKDKPLVNKRKRNK